MIALEDRMDERAIMGRRLVALRQLLAPLVERGRALAGPDEGVEARRATRSMRC
jgi:site-specific recombinase XerC